MCKNCSNCRINSQLACACLNLALIAQKLLEMPTAVSMLVWLLTNEFQLPLAWIILTDMAIVSYVSDRHTSILVLQSWITYIAIMFMYKDTGTKVSDTVSLINFLYVGSFICFSLRAFNGLNCPFNMTVSYWWIW